LCIKFVNYWDTYTEMHGQQNLKYTEMHGQQNLKYTEMHGQQNVKKLCSLLYIDLTFRLSSYVYSYVFNL